jgi:hypothetical protein
MAVLTMEDFNDVIDGEIIDIPEGCKRFVFQQTVLDWISETEDALDDADKPMSTAVAHKLTKLWVERDYDDAANEAKSKFAVVKRSALKRLYTAARKVLKNASC